MICDVLSEVSFGSNLNVSDVVGIICAESYPNFDCKVDVFIRQGSGEPIFITSILKGECVNSTTDATVLAAGTWTILLDGFECRTFLNVIA